MTRFMNWVTDYEVELLAASLLIGYTIAQIL